MGLPLCLCCLHEACHESLTIYNFSSKNHSKASKPEGKKTDSGLINDARNILQLPLIWSVELMIFYVLLLLMNPNWVSIPLHIYFLFVGT